VWWLHVALVCDKQLHRPPWNGPVKPPIDPMMFLS